MRTLPLATALLAACAPTPSERASNESVEVPAPRATRPPPPATIVALEPLAKTDAADLAGELRCAFTTGGRPLLIAAANVDDANRATAVIRPDGHAATLLAREAGGFDALDKGGAFAGEGLVATVTPGADRATGHEGTRREATLRVAAGGTDLSFDGRWECGP